MLKTRVLTSLVLLSGFLAALFLLPDIYWAILTLVVIGIGAWEWGGMIKLSAIVRKSYVLLTVGLLGITLAVTATPFAFIQQHALFWGLLFAAIFWTLFAPVWLSIRHQFNNRFGMAFIGWLILVPTWLALVSIRRIGPELLLAILVAIWIADSAAYFAGKRFGKHKLAPKISPGKTWEGVIGAWIGVSIYGLLICIYFHLDYWIIVGLWGLTVLSIMGDLLESLVKRQASLKDSGSLLPGHGGVLDRIDGLTSSLPLAAFYIYFPLYYSLWVSHFA